MARLASFALLFVLAGCATPLDSNGDPVASEQTGNWRRFQSMTLGTSQATIERVYGQTTEWTLEYGDEYALFRDGRLQHTGSFRPPYKEPSWPVEIGMSRAAFEVVVGLPRGECASYRVDGYVEVFCYQNSKLIRKNRFVPPVV
jgi:hypothetical protein